MELEYHKHAFELAGLKPEWNEENLKILDEKESLFDIQFPQALREWYALENREDLLLSHSLIDYSESLQEFGNHSSWDELPDPEDVPEAVYNRLLRYNELFAKRKVLSIFSEQQGMIGWFLKLNHKEDPEVLVQLEDNRHELYSYKNTFSELIYTSVWDGIIVYGLGNFSGYYVEAVGKKLSRKALKYIEDKLGLLPSSQNPGTKRMILRAGQIGEGLTSWQDRDSARYFFHASELKPLQRLMNHFFRLNLLTGDFTCNYVAFEGEEDYKRKEEEMQDFLKKSFSLLQKESVY
ncbi:MAG: hypothetical protein H7A25_06090 [Leptospiraceae bacterium]|nr:hypothetical protein [Leptospiraceae bacterium]MCP5499453.1 hypothetical protein [Leptospiraceae bacterium]